MFISFEGIEGSGKSTLLKRVESWLKEEKKSYFLTMEPGGSELGQKLRAILLNAQNKVIPEAELFLYLADRAQHVNMHIHPALKAGKLVLCDRYADSTIVYQGYGRGLAVDELFAVNDMAVKGLWPDLTFLLDLEPELGLERARNRNKELGLEITEGRFEAEKMSFHKKIRAGYLDWAEKNKERFFIINSENTPEQIAQEVIYILKNRI